MSIIKDIIDCINLGQKYSDRERDGLQSLFDNIASEAQTLADIWMELLQLYRKGAIGNSFPDELQRKIDEHTFGQIGSFTRLHVFYESFEGTDLKSKINSEFVLAMADMLEVRHRVREDFGHGFVVNDWLKEAPSASKIENIEAAVARLQEEAARLATLAQIHKSRMA